MFLFTLPLRADIVSARTALQQSRFAEAAEAYHTVIRSQPKNMEAFVGLSHALYALARYDDIINYFPEEIRKGTIDLNLRSPEVMAILKNIGFACYRSGQSKKAIVALSIAVKIHDDDAAVYSTLGLAYLNTGSFRLAEIAFQTAVNLEPSSPYYVNNLGAAYLEQSMYREALLAFERSVRNDRSFQNGWGNIWLCREKLGLPSYRGEYWFSYFLTATMEDKLAHQRYLDDERKKQESVLAVKRQQERQQEDARLAAERERLRQEEEALEARRLLEEQQRNAAKETGADKQEPQGGDAHTAAPIDTTPQGHDLPAAENPGESGALSPGGE